MLPFDRGSRDQLGAGWRLVHARQVERPGPHLVHGVALGVVFGAFHLLLIPSSPVAWFRQPDRLAGLAEGRELQSHDIRGDHCFGRPGDLQQYDPVLVGAAAQCHAHGLRGQRQQGRHDLVVNGSWRRDVAGRRVEWRHAVRSSWKFGQFCRIHRYQGDARLQKLGGRNACSNARHIPPRLAKHVPVAFVTIAKPSQHVHRGE
mmetsp:Transcript_86113/g.263567  ORF Transcript_86113/g.263567 Transcript_86113/m.263567 type:complete len:203 (+) Transcript_86113:1090-1698(+)